MLLVNQENIVEDNKVKKRKKKKKKELAEEQHVENEHFHREEAFMVTSSLPEEYKESKLGLCFRRSHYICS